MEARKKKKEKQRKCGRKKKKSLSKCACPQNPTTLNSSIFLDEITAGTDDRQIWPKTLGICDDGKH